MERTQSDSNLHPNVLMERAVQRCTETLVQLDTGGIQDAIQKSVTLAQEHFGEQLKVLLSNREELLKRGLTLIVNDACRTMFGTAETAKRLSALFVKQKIPRSIANEIYEISNKTILDGVMEKLQKAADAESAHSNQDTVSSSTTMEEYNWEEILTDADVYTLLDDIKPARPLGAKGDWYRVKQDYWYQTCCIDLAKNYLKYVDENRTDKTKDFLSFLRIIGTQSAHKYMFIHGISQWLQTQDMTSYFETALNAEGSDEFDYPILSTKTDEEIMSGLSSLYSKGVRSENGDQFFKKQVLIFNLPRAFANALRSKKDREDIAMNVYHYISHVTDPEDTTTDTM